MTTPVIARATADDLEEVLALERASYADPWPASAFASLPENPRVYFAVARGESGAMLGYVVAWYVLDQGELANVAVAANVRRQGIGRALLEGMLSDGAARGVGELFLEVRESNAAARRLYDALDFVEVGRRKGYYRSPSEDALILRRRFRD